MEPLRLTVDATPSEVARYLDRLLAVVPVSAWHRRIQKLIRTGSDAGDPTILADDYQLEFAMADLLAYRLQHGSLPTSPRTPEEYALLAFVVTFSQIYDQLSPAGQNRLAGSVRGALRPKDKIGLAPLAFEMSTAMHLATRDFGIAFHDLESGDPEHAAFAGIERMHVAGHAGRHHPFRDRTPIEKRAIDDRAGRVHAATDAGRAHARTLARAARRAVRRPGGRIAAHPDAPEANAAVNAG